MAISSSPMQTLSPLPEIEAIAKEIDEIVPATPQFSWPLLNQRTGCELWVKHENHTAIGSFKIRGAVNYANRLMEREPGVKGVIAATRGNFGQAVAFAGSRLGLASTIVVPHGNSAEKNRSMRAWGAELIEHGEDFQAALVESRRLASLRGLHWIPSFHLDLVRGNAASMLNFLRAAPALESVYIAIGLGSGACALAMARDALGLSTRIVGVSAERAPAAALSFEARRVVVHPSTTRIADGMASSTPDTEALELMLRGVERIVRVSDEQIEAAMRAYFSDTHNVAEGAAASALAAILSERRAVAGRRVGVVFSGGNVDTGTFARVLAGV
jgi:threonine dehydratase